MRLALTFVAVATASSVNLATITPVVTAGHQAYYCEYPKSVTVGKHTVTTPEICVPSP